MLSKMLICISISSSWIILCAILAIPWINDLSDLFGLTLSLLIVFGVALIPGWANAYLIAGLLLDRRPIYKPHTRLPPVSVLIAAYNEQECIFETLHSVARQQYTGEVEIVVINDGSSDDTLGEIERARKRLAGYPHIVIHCLDQQPNQGKSTALNYGLAMISDEILVTVDADTTMYRDSLARFVINLVDGPMNIAAVAGTVLVKNSRETLMGRLQEWDYFLGIAVVKRIQSL